MNIQAEIFRLKKEKKAIILSHNYQREEIQDIADYVGDSLGLSQTAKEVDCELIIFCGVEFMAENASVLNPDKTVLVPNKMAGCPMADMINEKDLTELKNANPGVPVVCYVNSTAAVKALSDICCTSANMVKVVESLNTDRVIFIPDANMAEYLQTQTEVEVIPYQGYCPTHAQILLGDLLLKKEEYPEASVLIHPECRSELYPYADAILSTEGMGVYADKSSKTEFLIGTEIGLIYRLNKENPGKKFYPISEYTVCPNMKMHRLEQVLQSLKLNQYVVKVPEEIRLKAKVPLDRMMKIGRGEFTGGGKPAFSAAEKP